MSCSELDICCKVGNVALQLRHDQWKFSSSTSMIHWWRVLLTLAHFKQKDKLQPEQVITLSATLSHLWHIKPESSSLESCLGLFGSFSELDAILGAILVWFVFRFSFFDIQLKVKLICFSFFAFRFSLFAFRFSLFVFLFFDIRFSFFDIRIRAEYRILTFEILFWHLKSGQISHFDIQNLILTFELGPNIEFWHSKSYFDIRIRAEYRILTFKMLFWHSNSGWISNFDIQNPILTFKFGPNIEFWHSKSYFDIRIRAEYRILTYKILFWHSNLGRISNFDIQNPILTFELGPNIEFWHSKSYFDIRIRAKYQILTFKILFWHSNSGHISTFDIQNPIWHSNLDRISNFDIQNTILTFEFGPNIEFWHSKS